jgi:23S rRNA pseudouridine2457 synthase
MHVAFHKPYGVLSQFSPDGSTHRTLAEFGFPKNIYPLGRLDATSEGLLLLSDEPGLNEQLLHPRHRHTRTYWAQVERVPSPAKLRQLAAGVSISGYQTLPCSCRMLDPVPRVPDRSPPIRFRLSVPTTWLELELVEGKNHQVRKMTAAIGHPTLRLIRVKIANLELGNLPAGQWTEIRSIEV